MSHLPLSFALGFSDATSLYIKLQPPVYRDRQGLVPGVPELFFFPLSPYCRQETTCRFALFAVSISGKPERGCFVFGFCFWQKTPVVPTSTPQGKKTYSQSHCGCFKIKVFIFKIKSLVLGSLPVCERESSKQRCMQMPARLPCVCTKKKRAGIPERWRLHPFYAKGKRPIHEGTKLRFQIRCPERLLFRLPWIFALCCSNKEPRSILMSSEGLLYPSQQALWGSPSLRGESSCWEKKWSSPRSPLLASRLNSWPKGFPHPIIRRQNTSRVSWQKISVLPLQQAVLLQTQKYLGWPNANVRHLGERQENGCLTCPVWNY